MADEDFLSDDDLPERDPNTGDMFGDAPALALPADSGSDADGAAYTVIARKYRPRTFEHLYGQEAMVRTLRNAFASGRIAHAFMLTGVRGVGKTTTARLLARALNYQTDAIDEPTIDFKDEGRHCRSIIEGRHMDVLELDAASRTGVADMRELLEGVRYAPVEARYKVYIIDEVHMLSTGAFNALLKTLEEPPPHAKFIFATTEIRKVPVTILSRTQRFDLRRVEPDVLVKNLEMICENEGARVDAEGLMLIARAAEGSVRDGQSMLDQAIVQAESGLTVSAASIRDMLGLADRAQTITLFEQLMRGEAGPAIESFRTLYGFGANPDQVMLDLLDHCHGATVAKAGGDRRGGLRRDPLAPLAADAEGLRRGAPRAGRRRRRRHGAGAAGLRRRPPGAGRGAEAAAERRGARRRPLRRRLHGERRRRRDRRGP
jgi:DNA polymerase-3 subunit gamma/tau